MEGRIIVASPDSLVFVTVWMKIRVKIGVVFRRLKISSSVSPVYFLWSTATTVLLMSSWMQLTGLIPSFSVSSWVSGFSVLKNPILKIFRFLSLTWSLLQIWASEKNRLEILPSFILVRSFSSLTMTPPALAILKILISGNFFAIKSEIFSFSITTTCWG